MDVMEGIANLPRNLFERAPVPGLTTIDGTVMSVVYVTAQPNFSGVIGSYTTLGQGGGGDGDNDDDPATDASYAAETSTFESQSKTTATGKSETSQTHTTGARTISHSSASAASTPSAQSALSTSGHGSSTVGQSPVNTADAESHDTSSSSSSGGLSMAARTGLAAGIICGIGLIAALILLVLVFKRRQQKRQAQAENEKKAVESKPPQVQRDTPPSPEAPRLSLRPVSKLIPGFMGSNQQDNTHSQGNMLTPISEAANARARNQSPMTQMAGPPRSANAGDNPFRDPENPFADPEKALGAPGNNVPTIVEPATASTGLARDTRNNGPTAESFPLPQAQPLGQSSTSTTTPRSNPALAPITVPNTNTHVELPAAPSPTVAQGPGPDMPQGNVYRILMDFRPTMEDELELRAGQLVRLLHEYDDGWALCIRLDRSQQGVVPRTCLAAKPSKPRPGPGPMGPVPRPLTPQGRIRVQPSPQGPQPSQGASVQTSSNVTAPVTTPASTPARTQSPAPTASDTGAFNQTPRPLSPGPRPVPQKRSMSPGPYGGGNGPKPMATTQQRRRSNSVGALNVRSKRNSPPGPSKLGPGTPPARSDSPGLAM